MARCEYRWYEVEPAVPGEMKSVFDRMIPVQCHRDATTAHRYTHPKLVRTYGAHELAVCDQHWSVAQLEERMQHDEDGAV